MLSFLLISVQAFVERAGHVLSQEGLEFFPRGDGGVAGERERACHSITQRTCHGSQVSVLWKTLRIKINCSIVTDYLK